MPRKIRPVGQPTRGKTALNRLRQIDIYVALTQAETLSSGRPLVIDIGFGAYPWTTLEMRERWLPINPRLRVLGVEIDPERVEAALPYAEPPAIEFRLGGFNLADICGIGTAQLIRCYNVLRQYDESAVGPALDEMAQALEPGGLLIEGTSNPSGRLVVFDVYCKRDEGLHHEALVFGTNFNSIIEPKDFQAILPKRLIHHMLDAAPVAFFQAWTDAYRLAKGAGHSGRQQWISAGRFLQSRFDYPIDVRRRILRRGFVALRDPLMNEV